MKAKDDLSVDYVHTRLTYDPETGNFWIKDGGSRPNRAGKKALAKAGDRPIIYIDNKQRPAARLAWLLMTGAYPQGRVRPVDGDPFNLRFDNLYVGSRPKPQITAEYLRMRLLYDPETGIFRWRRNPMNDMGAAVFNARFEEGEIAGYICKRTGYVIICLDDRRFLGHRLAWLYVTGEWPYYQIDHRDTNRANNAFGNLRQADNGKNSMNRNKQSNNQSGFKGVYLCSDTGRWRAEIRVDGTRYKLGRFDTPEEAHMEYRRAAEDLHGEFARA